MRYTTHVHASALLGALLVLLPTAVTAGARLTLWSNTALGGQPNTTTTVPSVAYASSGVQPFSAEFVAALSAPTAGQYAFDCKTTNVAAILWLDDHLLCGSPELFGEQGSAPLPPFIVLEAGTTHRYFIRVHIYRNTSTVAPATFELMWQINQSSAVPVPPSALYANELPQAQEIRDNMQRQLATGWATWWRPSTLAVTVLPEAATLTVGLCEA
eukprot:SAG31_NODE_7457_length_1684_cov_2.406309_1_plen_213_part_10